MLLFFCSAHTHILSLVCLLRSNEFISSFVSVIPYYFCVFGVLFLSWCILVVPSWCGLLYSVRSVHCTHTHNCTLLGYSTAVVYLQVYDIFSSHGLLSAPRLVQCLDSWQRSLSWLDSTLVSAWWYSLSLSLCFSCVRVSLGGAVSLHWWYYYLINKQASHTIFTITTFACLLCCRVHRAHTLHFTCHVGAFYDARATEVLYHRGVLW